MAKLEIRRSNKWLKIGVAGGLSLGTFVTAGGWWCYFYTGGTLEPGWGGTVFFSIVILGLVGMAGGAFFGELTDQIEREKKRV